VREGKRFSCPQCGETSPYGVTCPRCSTVMIDENGNPPLKPKLPRPSFLPSGWTISGSGFLFLGYLLVRSGGVLSASDWGMVGFAFSGSAFSFAMRVVLPRVRAGARAALRRAAARERIAAVPSAPIAAAAGGRARIRGRVKILRPCEGPTFSAAFQKEVGEQDCGRFAVVDGSGVAIVDDDVFEIWTKRTTEFAPDDAGGVVLDGAEVEVIGRAAVAEAADVATLGEGRYRESPQALVFDGHPDDPVVLIV